MVWDAAAQQEILRILSSDFVYSLTLSPDGRYVAAGRELAVGIWDLETRQKNVNGRLGHRIEVSRLVPGTNPPVYKGKL